MKTILGLDLGPNSIGWAKVEVDDKGNYLRNIKLGSRIIPMDQGILGKFDSGVTESQTAIRTNFRGVRRLRERHLQRRERLHRVLHALNFLPKHYEDAIGWDRNEPAIYGKFINNSEPKLAWERQEDGSMRFLFMESFYEMMADFAKMQPSLVSGEKKIPLDWTIYYLRKKALTQQIKKEELAWILLNFNQKRGYYQLRGEEEEDNPTKRKEYYKLKVIGVEADGAPKAGKIWYNIHLENGWTARCQSKVPLDNWVGNIKEYVVTTEYEADGETPKYDKEGKIKRSFKSPEKGDWQLIKTRTEKFIESSNKTVGTFIYDHLLKEPFDKIRGKYIRTIERKYYKNELYKILCEQAKYHKELDSLDTLNACAKELYKNNQQHQEYLLKKDMKYLLLDDLIFYQRPLKSKKSLIADCPYEVYKYNYKQTGKKEQKKIKCIAKSNPYYQEFRLWQFISNIHLFNVTDGKDVTSEYLKTKEDYVRLFTYLNDRKEIKQETLLKGFLKLKKETIGSEKIYPIRWNYIEDANKSYPCNTTRHELLLAFDRAGIQRELLNVEGREYRLWHLLYSIESKDKTESALRKLKSNKAFSDLNIDDAFVNSFLKIKPFKKEYGAYSEKAIKKLLAVMRRGSLWKEADICEATKQNIAKILQNDIDEKLKKKIEAAVSSFNKLSDFQGLPTWLACYVVYGRHSEAAQIQCWQSPEDLKTYINKFKQHSLRNPIVEQCLLETLRTVYDIWKDAGQIDEIHIELGRNMKSTAEQRARKTNEFLRNENTNLRIKNLLMELKNDDKIENVRPYSPSQQEILRIYEEGALQELSKEDEMYEDISKISKMAQPSPTELSRYKLWLEQKYRSPYTGRVIPLSKLFTTAYQIEHIIPQSRYFDDSFNNKVICESEVNSLKDNMLGYEFIKECGGQKVHCTLLEGNVEIFTEEEYKTFVTKHYVGNPRKKDNLLLEDIPQEFSARQLNDSRYISKMVQTVLSNIVRTKDEQEAISKFVVSCNGMITDRLKKDWGLNDVWNTIVCPRFKRLNEITKTNAFGHWEDKAGKHVFQTIVPLELQRGFSKKRIDHRHHAMDALVIACASRNIVNYLNNESANSPEKREDLRKKLCDEKRKIRKPWKTFTQDTREALSDVVVSFKNYVRVINKATNYYEHYSSSGNKVMISQKGNDMWAIRKPLHKESFFGHVNLRRKATVSLKKALENIPAICDKTLRDYINALVEKHFNTRQLLVHFKSINYRLNRKRVDKVEVWQFSDEKIEMVARRKPLDTSFDAKQISFITDTGIQKILLNYLQSKEGNAEIAFTPEGIEEMNKNISIYNDGKAHQPILNVRVATPKGMKYPVGQTGNKATKFVVAEKGTNLYFAIYENELGERSYDTIPLDIVIKRLKEGQSPVPQINKVGIPLKFYLSPNDLVYVPTKENEDELCRDRIYKFVDSSGTTANFVPHTSANTIYNVDKEYAKKYCNGAVILNEYGLGSPQSKNQKDLDGEMIKEICWKLKVDRLGNIIKVIK